MATNGNNPLSFIAVEMYGDRQYIELYEHSAASSFQCIFTV